MVNNNNNNNKRKKRNDAKGDQKAKRAAVVVKKAPIPVTILSGFLGSGKTTLLQHILTSKDHGLKIAVIVNDMSELNVDGQTIIAQVKKTKKEVITLENGCICCTLRGDLIREINDIQKTQAFDYVLIESTGVAEPQQVAESFCVDPETEALAPNAEQMLWNVARLDTCVTVVDALNFADYLSSLHRFKDIFNDGLDDSEDAKVEGEKSISELMVEQVEFANVILLNKVDLVTQEKIQVTKKLIQVLNPKARVVEGSFGKIDLLNILNTNLFDMQEASESPGWLASLKDGVNAAHGEADEYGVTSFVYRARNPFHPHRLHCFLKQLFCFAEDWAESPEKANAAYRKKPVQERYGSILRSKGTGWIAGRDHRQINWAQSGRIVQLSLGAPWYCQVPEEEWDNADSEEDRLAIQDKFDGDYGDRRQEVVFIGTNLNQEAIEKELNRSLLSEEEMEQHSTALPIGTYPDPLIPVALGYDGAQSLFFIARQGQDQHIRVLPGSSFCLQNLALSIKDEDTEDCIRAVKVWLDKSDGVKQGVLLATLRPRQYEQHSMCLTVLPCEREGEGAGSTYRRIRIEVVPKKGANEKSPDEWLTCCEVHAMGKIEPLPYSEDSDGDDDTADETDEDDRAHCETGDCPF